jgi:MarR family transcriptional regulator, organic hydroperoxide resistance regulator
MGPPGTMPVRAAEAPRPAAKKGEPLFYQDYLPYLLARAAHQVAGRFHDALRAHDLTVLTWRVLAALSDGGNWTVTQLCEVSLAKQPTVSKLLDRLAKQRLVVRSEDAGDGRRVLVRITPLGRHKIEPAIREATDYNLSILGEHPPADVEQLKRLLRALIARHPR